MVSAWGELIVSLADLARDEPWEARAVCEDSDSAAKVRQLCAACPVKIPCAERGRARRTQRGIWGGENAKNF